MENQIPVAPTQPIDNTQQAVIPEQPQKSNFLTILLSILLFLAIVIASFFAYQTQKLSKELNILKTEPESTFPMYTEPDETDDEMLDDPTANWETYVDIDNKYSFKYPNGWTPSTDVGILNDSKMNYILDIQNKVTSLTLAEWINENICTMFATEKDQNGCTVLIDGPITNSKQFTFLAHYSGMHTVVKNLNNIFDISLSSREPNLDFTEIQDTYDNILSTFKFLN